MRVLILRRALQHTLQRAIMVIILEQRQYSGTHTHTHGTAAREDTTRLLPLTNVWVRGQFSSYC